LTEAATDPSGCVCSVKCVFSRAQRDEVATRFPTVFGGGARKPDLG